MSLVIKVENVSKQYRLGQVGTGSISHDINRWWHIVRGKEDPYLKVGEVNDRTQKGSSEYVWALQNIGFEVRAGEVLGIIGRNGAGKSTLLKILSRTTLPTTGSINIKGRIASLLEVGTGFHPELTGRENIFLNGAILGMTKSEIKSKFDEIVDFSGVEKYIDTPVKRYSSGMYVRLAFAVAAHLEPEILIVDEVLAVGDSEFQKKCLGKMKDVSVKDGRTVLFVSHNMAAVAELCTNGIVLMNGNKIFEGTSQEAISEYKNIYRQSTANELICEQGQKIGNESFDLKQLTISSYDQDEIDLESGFDIKTVFHNNVPDKTLGLSVVISNDDEIVVFEAFTLIGDNNTAAVGEYTVNFRVPGNLLNSGKYFVSLIFAERQRYVLFAKENILSFNVENKVVRAGYNLGRVQGIIRPAYETTVTFNGVLL